ncbi:MAG: hypothetical protein KJP01_06110 [Gramella sp.]|nr:hypothetical protein [Christiangramia sp.]
MKTKEKHLYYLSELKDYKVNSKDPDIRNWEVRDLDNRTLGKVDNLLVNKELGKVVYIDVEVDQSIINLKHDPFSNSGNSDIHEFINKEGENHIIVPIGLIDLNLDKKIVFTDGIDYETFAETKRYRSGTTINRNYERHVLGSYQRDREFREKDDLEKTRSPYAHEESPDNQSLRERDQEKFRTEPSNEIEERIRREKENLRYSSNEKRHSEDSKKDQLKPERTFDEDNNWKREDTYMEVEKLDSNRHGEDHYEDDFYNKRAFKRKEID